MSLVEVRNTQRGNNKPALVGPVARCFVLKLEACCVGVRCLQCQVCASRCPRLAQNERGMRAQTSMVAERP
eukprot:724807-Alexandrium_andersonii.AAC.1